MKKKIRRHKTRIEFLEREEVRALIDAGVDERERALMATLFSTGMRVSECVALKRADLERADIDETKDLSIIGKGGWQRVVFFSPECLQQIRTYLATREDRDPRLFPFTKRTAERIVKRAGTTIGIDAWPHILRHSLATHVLRSGANIRVVQEMLGHRALSSTMVYTGVANKDLLEAHKRYV